MRSHAPIMGPDGFCVQVHSSWFLLAWVVVAAASGWKFWRITSAWRQGNRFGRQDVEATRASLERRWSRSER